MPRVVDIERCGDQLIGHVRDEGDEPLKQLQRVSRERLDFDRVFHVFRHALHAGHQERLFLHELQNPHPLIALNCQTHGAVWDAHHLVDCRNRSHVVDVVGSRPFQFRVLLHDQRHSAVARHHVVNQPQRSRLCGSERHYR
jgi:hypothetical protein